jgi:hypothetical protein
MEFCPVCMLRKGLGGGVASGKSSFEERVRRIPDQLPKRFEHYKLVTGEAGKPVALGRSPQFRQKHLAEFTAEDEESFISVETVRACMDNPPPWRACRLSKNRRDF